MKKKIRALLTPILQKVKRIIYTSMYNNLKKKKPLNEKKIILASNRGTILKENLLWIYNELQKEKDYEVLVLLTDTLNYKYSMNLIKEMSDAKYTIIDDFFPLVYPLKIREGAKLIQVWHALGAFKRVGFSRMGKVGGPSQKSITHKNYTDVIVSSESIVDNYQEAFQVSRDKIHPLGVQRTDFFFDEEKKKQAVEKIYNQYPNLKGKRVILFAPTFRGNGRKTAHYPPEYFDINKVYKSLNDNDILIIKNHPFVKEQFEITEEQSKKIIDLTSYTDINELFLITDLLITDYSSSIFEYALLDRPTIFYVPDIDDYKESRDFYYDFSEYTYGDVCKNIDELVDSIKHTKLDKQKLAKFKEKFLNMCDGHATKRFIDVIIKGNKFIKMEE